MNTMKAVIDPPLGLVVDMVQPYKHVYHPDANDDDLNYYGTLQLTVQEDKVISSRPAVNCLIAFTEGTHVTVRDLIKLICDNKLQHYKFHPEGSGCLFWQLNLLDVIAHAGWIPEDSSKTVRDAIVAFRSGNDRRLNMILYPPVEGTFCDPPTVSAVDS